MPTSKFWKMGSTPTRQDIKKLEDEKNRLQKEIEALRERDVLKHGIKTMKKEKFLRSRTGRIYLMGAETTKRIGRELTKPETKRAMSKLGHDITRLGKKILSD